MKLNSLPKLDIVSIFKHYGFKLTPSGDRYITHCVFHNDVNTPNLTIYPKTESFFCFTCKKSGDALTLISFMEKKPIHEIKKLLGTDFLRYTLHKEYKKHTDFFKTLLKDSSLLFYNYIKAYPDRIDFVIKCMEKFDLYLNDVYLNKIEIDFQKYITILDNLKKILYNNEIIK